jgi:arginine/serine-rich splicing factor 4/5/6
MRIRVEYAKGPRRDRTSKPVRAPENRVIVDNLHHSVSWQSLKDYMRRAGDVVYADVEPGSRGGGPKGVVEFRTYEEMKTAIRKLDNTELNGSKIFLKEVRIFTYSVTWLVLGRFASLGKSFPTFVKNDLATI